MVLMDLTCDTAALRRALTSCAAHLPSPKVFPDLARTRLWIGRHVMFVGATNRSTIALGRVRMDHNAPDRSTGVIDLSPGDAAKILAVFKVSADGQNEVGDPHVLRIEVLATPTRITDPDTGETEDQLVTSLRLTDVSGLIAGDELELPAMQRADKFPDLPRAMAAWVQIARQIDGVDFGVGGTAVTAFLKAVKAYDQSPVLSVPDGSHALVWQIGPDFIGISSATRVDPFATGDLTPAEQTLRHWIDGWRTDLPVPAPGPAGLSVWQDTETETDGQTRPVDVDDLVDRGELREAITLVVTSQFGSAAMLQRKMRIGFARAHQLLNEMEGHGLVGAADGTKARPVLVTPDHLNEVFDNILGPDPDVESGLDETGGDQ